MSKLTTEVYEEQQANCDNLCNIDEARVVADTLPCVTCPFCKTIVTAELTPTTIHCPACHTTVNR